MNRLTALITMVVLLAGGWALACHPVAQPPLTPDGPFPRCTAEQLARCGFPDHQHAYFWPGWQPRTGADGRPFGFGSICSGRVLLHRTDLVRNDSLLALPGLELHFNPGYKPCDVASLLELLEAARHDLRDLLGLTRDDTLVVVNTDRTELYKQATRQGTWRMYLLRGDTCLVQPIPVLTARTLVGHAAYDLYTRWLLQQPGLRELPVWFRDGLAAYTAELGVHLNNYLFMYRSAGPVLFTPDQVDAILASPPRSDPAEDQQLFRRARYSAFLMVWRLVEEQGGLAPVRRVLAAAAGGRDPDDACRQGWGVDWRELARRLDPVAAGEDPGVAMGILRPHLPPPAEPAAEE